MADKTQSEAARRSARDSRVISLVGFGAFALGLPLMFVLRNLGWSPDAALYAGLLAGAPVFGGLLYWVWRRNTSTAETRRR